MKLDLGAGAVSPAGFTPLGYAHGSEIFPLPFADGSIDTIRCSHALEHFPHRQVPAVIADWVRALRPGGELKIAVPNFRAVAEGYLAGARQPTEGYIMGGQADAADYHKALFDEEHLREILAGAGLVLLRPWTSEVPADCASLPVSLNLAGTKPFRSELKIAGVMTTPRLGFNDMWNCAIQALPRLGISLKNVSGAFWDQCLSLAIEQTIAEATPDYVLAIDYDSVFHAGHAAKLVELAMVHPEADAIAPVQSSRHGGAPLLGLAADEGEPIAGGTQVDVERSSFEVDLKRVRQAHFGLTLLRTDRLQALSKPWFLGRPNAAGEWRGGKLDPDIHFWRAWEAAGFSLFLAPRVVIGHLELMVRWPDADSLSPIWQQAKDWEATRKPPAGVWTGVPE